MFVNKLIEIVPFKVKKHVSLYLFFKSQFYKNLISFFFYFIVLHVFKFLCNFYFNKIFDKISFLINVFCNYYILR